MASNGSPIMRDLATLNALGWMKEAKKYWKAVTLLLLETGFFLAGSQEKEQKKCCLVFQYSFRKTRQNLKERR
ncbi:hypothetical protein L195_g014065 [Trifolium pratense]|uniref:Uncharacterized protein n=1 Tax=Trifolium pratense TaxID=57577 RepID=A0A2K3PPY4_TRIPR|nr:hypothetical protein L195_g001243 [Trifolium pratense]PNY17324.1 hypothetical protein L195_g014065 [Trifolium pratense]